MEKNYIILAHNNPSQLNRLVNKLNDGASYFFIHIDKKADITPFIDLIQQEKVHFIQERVACIWGDYSLVQATINCIREIIRQKKAHVTILLSGQCYPFVSNEAINHYLKENSQYDHINIRPIENAWVGYRDRIEKYRINFSGDKGNAMVLPYFFETSLKDNIVSLIYLLLQTVRNRRISPLFLYFKTFKKRMPPIQPQFGGSQWWAFTYETLQKVLHFLDQNPAFTKYHQFTTVPDEIVFQTIIHHLSLTDDAIKVKNMFTYINWTRSGRPLPVVFNEHDYQEIMSQAQEGKLFARKFDLRYCERILDKIDGSV